MASVLSAELVWNVQAAGSAATHGGAFKTGASGTDYSKDATPAHDASDWECPADDVVLESQAGGIPDDVVGNLIYIASGTNFVAGFYEIVAWVSNKIVTLKSTPTSPGLNASAGVGKIGGAQAAPQLVADTAVAGNTIYLKGDVDYTLSAGSSFTPANDGTANAPIIVRGYTMAHGDATQPVATLIHATDHVVACTTDYWRFEYLTTTGNAGVAKDGFNFSAAALGSGCHRCWAKDNGAVGIYLGAPSSYTSGCEISGWGQAGASYGLQLHGASAGDVGSNIHGGTGPPVYRSSLTAAGLLYSLIHGSDTYGIQNHAARPFPIEFCVVYGNADHGVYSSAAAATIMDVVNSIIAGNGTGGTGDGIASAVAGSLVSLYGTAFQGNQDNEIGSNVTVLHDDRISLTVDPFVDAANDDFRLTRAGRKLLEEQGFPTQFLQDGALTTWKTDPLPGVWQSPRGKLLLG